MTTVLLVGALVCVLINLIEVALKLASSGFVLDNATAIHVAHRWIPWLATIEAAGALGVLIGLAGTALTVTSMQILGMAAAIGLVGFFIVAVGFHLRWRVLRTIGFPGFFLITAICAVGYFWMVIG